MSVFGSYPPVPNVESVSTPSSPTVHLAPLLGSPGDFQIFSARIEESLDMLNENLKRLEGKRKKKKKAKSFLRQVGDAFCKALTPILISLGNAVIGCILGPKHSSQNVQRA